MAVVFVISAFVLLEIFVVFVDSVICQMLEEVGHVLASGRLIRLCRKSGETLLEKVDSEGVHTGHQNVESEIKFQVVD